jgi:hypothetical protein
MRLSWWRRSMEPRELLEEVKRRIVSNPFNYNQNTFCGTVCCVAGHIDCVVNGAEVHNARPARSSFRVVDNEATAALGEASSPWLFGQVRDALEEDDAEDDPDYWPLDLSIKYVDADGAEERAAVACEAIDRYLAQRKL